jgi:hypothetical protein
MPVAILDNLDPVDGVFADCTAAANSYQRD